MIWTFKKAVKEPRPPAPCGNDKTHYYWRDMDWPCPICRGIAKAAEDEAKENHYIEKLATAIAQKLKENP